MSKRVVLFFVLTLIICLLAPLTCDDWGNSVIYSNLNIIDYFKESIDMYFTWEGRFVSRILICILTPLKLLWSIITPFMLTLIYYIGLKLLGEKGKEVSKNLLFIALLLININMFSQSYIWIAGSITYLYPTALSFLYFYYLYKKNGESFSILETIILVLGCITIPMFVENIGCSFVLGNIIFLIYDTYKNKRIDKKLLIFSIISIVSIFVMLISPGSKLRTNVNTEFYQMDVFSKICSNIPNLIFTMFTSNIILILITIIPIIYTLFKSDKIKSGVHKDILANDRPMTEEERQLIQNIVDENYDEFVNVVAEGRKLDRLRVKELADGRIYSGRQAKELGLVDELGNLYDVIDKTAQEVGIQGKPKIKEFNNGNPFSGLLEGKSKVELIEELFSQHVGESELKSIVPMAIPAKG